MRANTSERREMNNLPAEQPTEICPPDATPVSPEGSAAVDALAGLARALSHPARVTILKALLARKSCVVGELVDALPLAPSTVSQHLKVLKSSGLIKGEVDGPRRCYCVDQSVLGTLKRLINDL